MTRSSEDVPPGTDSQEHARQERSGTGSGGDLSSFDRAINDLQGKISDLRGSVDRIGGDEASQPAGYEPPPPGYSPPPPPPTYAPPAHEPPPAAYEQPAYEQPPAYEPPPYAEPVPGIPGEPPPEVFLDAPAEPAAVPGEGSDPLGSFSRVDVGPFEDLLAMTAFEEQLSALPSMANVRVRRFGAGRAEIEIETDGIAPIAREVMRVAPDARPATQPDGSLVVELTDPRWTGGADAGADADGAQASEAAEGERGEPGG